LEAPIDADVGGDQGLLQCFLFGGSSELPANIKEKSQKIMVLFHLGDKVDSPEGSSTSTPFQKRFELETSTLKGLKNIEKQQLPRNLAYLGFTILYSKLAEKKTALESKLKFFIKLRAAMIL